MSNNRSNIINLIKGYILFFVIISCNNSTQEKTKSLSDSDLISLANSYYKSFDYNQAKTLFDTLLLLNPYSGEYYYKRGYSKYMLRNDTGAIPDFLNSIKYNYKNKKGAFVTLGTIYRIIELYDSAVYYYDKSLEIDPNYEKALRGKAEVLMIIDNKLKL